MRDQPKHFPVNWVDGMKINKDHFIAQDDAQRDALQDMAAAGLSPLRYGLLPAAAAGSPNFNVKIILDNQQTLRATIMACDAITQGGVRIAIPALPQAGVAGTDGFPTTSFQFSPQAGEGSWWVVLVVNPFDRQPTGSPDVAENPPRYPFTMPGYSVQVVSENQLKQFAGNPYALTVGKVMAGGAQATVDAEYIPPCLTVSAHPDLVSLHSELDQFLGSLESKCSLIVQKIYKKSQQNDISELVMHLCDRIIIHLAQAITQLRWTALHEPPAGLFAQVAALARVMKNTIDLRIGSGKDEMMNYLSEWSELKQGELENMLSALATLRYNHNDVNSHMGQVISFVKTTAKLFDTLSKLEFIGKKKESGIFVKEEINTPADAGKARRRFFG